MKVEYRNKFPKWVEGKEYYDLCLTNDIDSLLSCMVLKEVKGWNINYYCDFKKLYELQDLNNKCIGVDFDLTGNRRCFSNHVTMLSSTDSVNENSANFNNIDRISRENYFNKYCGSTALMIYSLYDYPLPKTTEGKMLLLAIDSTFKGFYSNYDNDNKSHFHYLVEIMGYEELYKLEQKYSINDFNNLIKKYRLNSEIWIWGNKLFNTLEFETLSEVLELPFFMPENGFTVMQEFTNKASPITLQKSKNEISTDIFNFVVTKKNYVNMMIQKGDC